MPANSSSTTPAGAQPDPNAPSHPNQENTPSLPVTDTGVLSLHSDRINPPEVSSASQPSNGVTNATEPTSATASLRRSLRHSASTATLAEQEHDDLIDSLNPEHDKPSSARAKSTPKSPRKKSAEKTPASSLSVLDHRITDVEAHQRLQDERLTITARELHERVDELSGSDFHATILQLEELHSAVSLMRGTYGNHISELQTAATLTTQTMAALKTTNNDLVLEVRRLSQDTVTTSNNVSQVSGDVAELKRRLVEADSDRSSLRNQVDNLSALVSMSQNRDDLSAPGAKRQRMDDAGSTPVGLFHIQTGSSPVLSLANTPYSSTPTLPPAPAAISSLANPPAPATVSHALPPAPLHNSTSNPGSGARGRRWGVVVGPMSFDDVDFGQQRPLLPVAINVIKMTGNERVNTSTVTASRQGANHLLMTWPWRNQAEHFMSAWKGKQPLPYPYNNMTATRDF
ncbi:hypothetical protein VKT23_014624 [Stygiomarasmius scandens]|uniref:Uncharacterized protein n=1 Tax=Marasmiellus scandens TaxID=2682957 RepID=A0ABR1J4H1_9AGAR